MSESLTALVFKVPLPPRVLSPNAARRGDWRTYQEAANAYRDVVWIYARNAGTFAGWEPPARVRVSIEFHTRHRKGDGLYGPMDCPNAVSAWKAGYDGLVKAGLFADDNWRAMELGSVRIDPSRGPAVVVTVEALEEAR